jgi:hypothetical protein
MNLSVLGFHEVIQSIGREPSLGEVEQILARLPNNKAAGPDGLTGEVLKAGGALLARLLHPIFCAMWENPALIPQEWKDATIIPIYKRGSRADPASYRPISLLNTSGKVLSKLIANRLRSLAEARLPPSQHGFSRKKSCSDLIYTLRRLQEHSATTGSALGAIFIDFRNAFDNVRRESLWEMLLRLGAPRPLIDVAKALHQGNTGRVKIGSALSTPFAIERGVRQGCPMAPIMFNLYLHCILVGAGCERWQGATAGKPDRTAPPFMMTKGELADDIVLVNPSADALQLQINSLHEVSSLEGMQISSKKTVTMWLSHPLMNGASHTPCPPLRINLGSNALTQVSSFRYLGSFIDTNRRTAAEIANRIQVARGKMFALHGLFKSASVSIRTKDKLVKQCILPALLYSAETWVTTKADSTRLQSFVNSALRFNRKISLLDQVPPHRLWSAARLAPVELLLAVKRVGWALKIAARPTTDLAKQASEIGVSQRPRGRPRLAWDSSISADIKKLGFSALAHAGNGTGLKSIIRAPGFVADFVAKQKPLSCPSCGKKYKTRGWLARHVAKHH